MIHWVAIATWTQKLASFEINFVTTYSPRHMTKNVFFRLTQKYEI